MVYQVVLTPPSVVLFLSLFRRMWSCQTLSLRSSKISWRAFCSETFPRGWAARAKGTSVRVSGPIIHTRTHCTRQSHQCPQMFQMNPSVGCLLPVPPKHPCTHTHTHPSHSSITLTHCGGGKLDGGRHHMTPPKPRTMADFTGAVMSHQLMTKVE